jgi:predicted transcriptional regulator
MNIILSIKPEWAKLIYEGKKTIEWRKTLPKKIKKGDKVFLYETSPVFKIIGHFDYNGAEIYDKNDDDVKWLRKYFVEDKGCVTIDRLNQYQGQSSLVYGWRVSSPCKFSTPKTLEEFGLKRPPQSWCYIKEKI